MKSILYKHFSIFKDLTLKHPCDKCIVRPCCTKICDETRKLEDDYLFPYTFKERKIMAWVTLLIITIPSILIILYSIFRMI